ncbi:hypothetical protein [Spongiibacter sp.]|uniref:hypothetical protein n=1 Tax=Spongiibacter sp. TaxID=2024860 RepID=UPI0035656C9C
MKTPTLTFTVTPLLQRAVLAIAAALLCSVSQAETSSVYDGELTLPADHRPGYQPTLRFCIEEDQTSGSFIAHSATQARFNRIWMNQHQAKTGKAAKKELIKLGAKALYRALHKRASMSFLPDEEGRVKLGKPNKHFAVDYNLHLRSSSLALGVAVNF